MKTFPLPITETQPFTALSVEISEVLSRHEKQIDECLNVLNRYLNEEYQQRRREHDADLWLILPRLASIPLDWDVANDEESSVEVCVGGIGWFFNDSDLNEDELANLGPSGLLEPGYSDDPHYSERTFRDFMPEAEDWEIELLMEVEGLVRAARSGFVSLAQAIRSLSEERLVISEQTCARVGEKAE